ncbi:MAG TPA: hypothetical protein VGS58_13305, partial [Candidatus Sulfopaludibacter sp.]|nr:hypothetical protein [Candidatus Sulfopaludibacter sp.]
VVKGRAGGDAHTGMPQGAPGATPAPGANGGSIGAMPSMPNGHPAVGGPSGALPPGHPPLDATKKPSDGK